MVTTVQHPAIYCMCCFGVNYNVVICKVSFKGHISFSAVNLQCNYNKTVNIYLLLK